MVGRIPGLRPSEWSDEVRELLQATVGPVSSLEGRRPGADEPRPLQILTVIARQPRWLAPFLGWASAVAINGVLPRRDHELLALRTAANCRSDFEWGHHVVYARAVGFDDGDLSRIVLGPEGSGWSTADTALLRAADDLHRDTMIDDETWAVLASRYEPATLVEIPIIVGQYTMLSMLANAAGVELETGLERLPAPPGGAAP